MPKEALVNVSAALELPIGPRQRVSEMQVKLHHWAAADPGRRFDDLFNLVHDPATLMVAFSRTPLHPLPGYVRISYKQHIARFAGTHAPGTGRQAALS